MPYSSCNASPPPRRRDPRGRAGRKGQGAGGCGSLKARSGLHSSKLLHSPAAAMGRSLNPEHQYPVKNIPVNTIFLCCLIFSLSPSSVQASASDSNPLKKAQPGFLLFFGGPIDTCQTSACSSSPALGQEQEQTIPNLPIKTLFKVRLEQK